MNGFLEALANNIRELLPSKDATTGVWLTKVGVLMSAALGSGVLFYWVIADTEWAVQRGLKKIAPTPAQTTIDLTQRRRKIFAEMGKVVLSDPNVYSIFVVNAYDPQTEHFNFKDPAKNTKILIRFSRLREDVDYYAFNTLETTFEQRMKDSQPIYRCTWGAITPSDKFVLTQTLGKNFDSDWYGLCPIFYKNVVTSASLVFYKRITPVNPYDDSDQLFHLRFEAFNQEVARILHAPSNSFASLGIQPDFGIPLPPHRGEQN